MRIPRLSLTLFVVLSSVPAEAAEHKQVAVEKVLRDNGLSPRARPTLNEENRAIVVRGTEQRPEFVVTSCTDRQTGRNSIEGNRFEYMSSDRGEWGGELNVREGNGPLRPIVKGNVQHLVPVENDLYVFTGLSHMGVSQGDLFVIENYDTDPRERLLTRLPGAPEVIAFDRNWRGFLIVSMLTVSVVGPRGNVDMVMSRHVLLPRPNSVLSMGHADILVGVCGGVAWIHAPWRMNYPPDPVNEIPIVTFWTRQ